MLLKEFLTLLTLTIVLSCNFDIQYSIREELCVICLLKSVRLLLGIFNYFIIRSKVIQYEYYIGIFISHSLFVKLSSKDTC